MNLFSSLLSNPDAMKNIKDILGNASVDEKQKPPVDNSPTMNTNDLNFLSNIINQGQNSEIIRKISNAYNVYSNNSTPGIRLLEALSPYLSTKRVSNLEKVKVAIKMSNAVSEFNKK